MRAGSKSARMRPLLGLARLISAMTAGIPEAIFARSACSNPRGAPAARASPLISPAGTLDFASSIWRRLAARMRSSTWETSARLGRGAREAHQLVELGAGSARCERLTGECHAVPEARRDARNVQRRGGIERDHIARGSGLVGENRLDARLRFRGVLHLDRLDRRHVEAELLRLH